MLIGMSQAALAKRVDLSYQQIQKYEEGTNRISAGNLMAIAETIGVHPTYFFEGLAELDNIARTEPLSDKSGGKDPLNDKAVIQLVLAFMAIRDPAVRRRLVALVESLAGE